MRRFSVPGKWVFSGEHAVLRGYPALAFPLWDSPLWVELEASMHQVGLQVYNEFGRSSVLESFWLEAWRTLEAMLGRRLEIQSGWRIRLRGGPPQHAGLGSSAALCVAIAESIQQITSCAKSVIGPLATRTEDRFHGVSSGMDCAVIRARKPILYWKEREPIHLEGSLDVDLLDTGLRSKTKDAIRSVQAFVEAFPAQAEILDKRMGQISLEAASLVAAEKSPDRTARLISLLDLAQQIFKAWGLVPKAVQRLVEAQERQGFQGLKLTGAGMGGFLIRIREQACVHREIQLP